MKAKEFNNFYEYLKNDRENAECLGWAFLQLTDKQICKVIDYYYIIGELTLTDKSYLQFGSFSYPLSEYEKVTGCTYYREYYTDTDYYIVKQCMYK